MTSSQARVVNHPKRCRNGGVSLVLYPSVHGLSQGDVFVTATGNIDVITIDYMRQMKDRAIVCNIGHFDIEIQIDALRNYPWEKVKPQVDEVVSPTANG